MGRNKNTDPKLEKLAQLHLAIVDSDRAGLADTVREPADTGAEATDLAEAEACLRLLERLRRTDSDQAASVALDLPKAVGRFRIDRLLGEGSYGTVYLAHDPELKRNVALKIPRPEVVLSPQLRERFLREAEVAASLQHPGVVRIFESGHVEGTLFISSEYCSGRSLAAWLNERAEPIRPQDAAVLVLALADGVQHAHSRGILHRDLKPGNILIDHDEKAANTKQIADALRITDFGLARFIDAPLRQTQTGAAVGTPAYMSPEQADGRDATSQSDIYALGCILYELLTRKTPFQADGVLKTLEAVRTQPPPRPGSIVAHIPADLEAICLKCLEKDAANRYASADRLAEDLSRFVGGQTVTARRVGHAERCWRWCRRNPGVAGAVSLAAVSVIVGIAAVTWQWQRAENYGRRADRDRARTREALDAMTSEQALELLTSQRELSANQREFLSTVATIYGELADEEPDSELAAERVANAHYRLASIHQRLGNYESAEVSFARAIERFRELSKNNDVLPRRRQLAAAIINLASMHYSQRRWEDVEEHLPPLDEFTAGLVGDEPESDDIRLRAKFLDLQANTCRETNRLAEAAGPRREAISLRERLVERDPKNERDKRWLSVSYNNYGNDLAAQRDPRGAEPWLQRSLEIKRELAGANPASARYQYELAVGLAQYGVIRYRMQSTDGVKGAMDEAIAINRKLVSRFPMDQRYAEELAFCCTNYTAILHATRDKAAVGIAAEAVAAWQHRVQHTPNEPHPRIRLAGAFLSQGNVRRDQTQHKEAINAYARAIRTIENGQLEKAHPDVGSILMNAYWGRATTQGFRGNHQQAVSDWDEAIAFAPDHVKLQLRLARATSQVQAGDTQAGLSVVEELAGPEQQDRFVLYNAACVMALVSTRTDDDSESDQRAGRAVKLLSRAIKAGFADFSHLENDPELQPLHNRDDFHALLPDD